MPRSGRQLVALVKPPKKRIAPKPRTPDEDARIYGPEAFRFWLHRQACAVCGWNGRVEQAHARTGGTGRKGDWTETFPACGSYPVHLEGERWETVEGCHRLLHRVGVKTFEKSHGVVLLDLAAKTQAQWQAFTRHEEDTAMGP